MERKRRRPRNGSTSIYRILAGGRYAAFWLPELLILYAQIEEEEGEKAAREWLLAELALTVRPAVAVRIYYVARLLFRLWRWATGD